MNKRKAKNAPKKRFSVKLAIALVTLAGLIALVALKFATKKIDKIQPVSEESMVARATQENISPGYSPVLIYQCKDDGNYFCCVGTVVRRADGRDELVTVEHLFRPEVSEGGVYGVRFLRPASPYITLLVEQIMSTSTSLQNNDIVTALLGSERHRIENFSRFRGDKSTGNRFRFNVKVDGKPVTRLKSVVSGEEALVLGAMEATSSAGSKLFVVMNYHALPSESGTGYVDDYGGLYVVHGSMDKDQSGYPEVTKIFSKILGTNALKGFTLLSGPVSQHK